MAECHSKKMIMFNCSACGAGEGRGEAVDEVFNVDGEYVLVARVPSTVCQKCGERSFSRETTEKVRLLVHKQGKSPRSVPLHVYEYA